MKGWRFHPILSMCPWARGSTLNCSQWHLANSTNHPLVCEYECVKEGMRGLYEALWDTAKVLKKCYLNEVNYHLIKRDKLSNCTSEFTWKTLTHREETNKLCITCLCVCRFLSDLWAYLPESTNTRKSPRRYAIH